jgi:hypothetical protein
LFVTEGQACKGCGCQDIIQITCRRNGKVIILEEWYV